jgi:hypothetical protein
MVPASEVSSGTTESTIVFELAIDPLLGTRVMGERWVLAGRTKVSARFGESGFLQSSGCVLTYSL